MLQKCLHVTQDSHYRDMIFGRRQGSSDVLGATGLATLKRWMATCRSHHDVCNTSWRLVSSQRKLPTRLLEITNNASKLHIRLVETNQLPNSTTYCTLSHCWGRKEIICLTQESYKDFLQSVPLERLSRTFRHAVHLTHELDCNYLWIDSLCIIQKNVSDWLIESSRMGEVYTNGYLNIAASAAEDGDGGLFFPESRSASPCILPYKSTPSTNYVCYHDDPWGTSVEKSPLGSRGWVVQERILSPRVAHFAQNQIYWECCQNRFAEWLPSEFLTRHDRMAELKGIQIHSVTTEEESSKEVPTYDSWNYLISRYTDCDLTLDSDKLIAISGLARRTCQQLKLQADSYLAGLWKPSLTRYLLWHTKPSKRTSRCIASGAPSWSWASMNGSIKFPGPQRVLSFGNTKYHVQILDAKTHSEGGPFDPLIGGYLVIQGPTVPLEVKDEAKIDYPPPLEVNQRRLRVSPGTVLWDNTKQSRTSFTLGGSELSALVGNEEVDCLDPPIDSIYVNKKNLVYLLIMHENTRVAFEISGLVLLPTEIPGQYQRLGVIFERRISNFELLMTIARDKNILPATGYRDFDGEKGFVIEII
jgi:Heterokaryon incompatibility protein (HET)